VLAVVFVRHVLLLCIGLRVLLEQHVRACEENAVAHPHSRLLADGIKPSWCTINFTSRLIAWNRMADFTCCACNAMPACDDISAGRPAEHWGRCFWHPRLRHTNRHGPWCHRVNRPISLVTALSARQGRARAIASRKPDFTDAQNTRGCTTGREYHLVALIRCQNSKPSVPEFR
jgi:hypothetical protein